MLGKYVFVKVVVFSILALTGGIYLSSTMQLEKQNFGYPWQVELLASGQTRVFQLTLGSTSLNQAQQLFKEIAEVSLFMPKDSKAVIEAYFGEVKMAGLKSKMVMSFDFSADMIEGFYERGVRISTLDSGTRKVMLADDDVALVRAASIASITYLPKIHLDAKLIENRFGQPAEKLADNKSDAIHWLYPEIGVDIALSEKDKEVILYVKPEKFGALIQPLKNIEQSNNLEKLKPDKK